MLNKNSLCFFYIILYLLTFNYSFAEENEYLNKIFASNSSDPASDGDRELKRLDESLIAEFAQLSSQSLQQNQVDISILQNQIPSYEEQQFNQSYQYYKASLAFLEQKRQELGEERFFQELEKDLIVYRVNGSAEVRFGLVGKQILANVLLNGNKLSTLFIDLDKINQDDPSFQRYVARQKLNFGNNVLVVKEQGGTLIGAEYLPHPKFFSTQWWHDFIKSVWVKPQKGDFVLGAMCGIYQGSLTICLNLAKTALANDSVDVVSVVSASQGAALMTAMFATTIGTFCSLYRNLIYVGPKYQRILKASIISLAFAYSFFTLTHPDGIAALDPFSVSGLLNNLHIGVNVFLTQYARDDWVQIARARAQLKTAKGTLKIGIINTGIPQANAELQAIYNFIQFPLKLLDLINFKIFDIPIGKIVFYASVPFIRKFNQIWFEHKYVELQNQYAQNPTPELAEHINKFKVRLDEIERAWEKLEKIGIYASLPIMKILQKQYYEEKLARLQNEYTQNHSAELELQINKLKRKIELIDEAWITATQKVPQQVLNVFKKAFQNIGVAAYSACQLFFKFFIE